jgi:hypothetical protein
VIKEERTTTLETSTKAEGRAAKVARKTDA